MIKRILLSLLVLLFVSSCLYLVPSFDFVYSDKRYLFQNFPSPFNQYEKDLKIRIPRLSETYVYKIESSVKLEKPEDWNNLVSKDQRILEQRLENVLGNNYEIEIKKIDNKAQFTVYTNTRLSSPNILTNPNSVFAIKTLDNQALHSESSSIGEKTLDLEREDFGFAEIISTNSVDASNQSVIRMPLGLFLVPEKIKLMSDNIGNQLNIEVAGNIYQGFIDYNQTGIPTNLVISGIASNEQAKHLKAFLNTPQYSLTYNFIGTEKILFNINKILTFIGLILGIIILAVVINRLTVNNFNAKKGLLILCSIAVFLAALKFFVIPLTFASIIIMVTISLFSIYNLHAIYYIGLLATFAALKAFGILNGFDLSGRATILLIIFCVFIWLTNYVSYKQNKRI